MLNQEKYIRYAAEFAAANAIHIRLGGSFQKGTASPYSDVDISVSGDVRHVKGSFGKCSPAIGALFRSPSADISWRKRLLEVVPLAELAELL